VIAHSTTGIAIRPIAMQPCRKGLRGGRGGGRRGRGGGEGGGGRGEGRGEGRRDFSSFEGV
jgi:hypothetical protein